MRTLLVVALAAAPLLGCGGAPIGADGKTADEIAVDGGRNACDPRDRLLGNPYDAAFPMATTELQRSNLTCHGAGPKRLIEVEGGATPVR
jgi:hypothetical protein